MKTDSNHKSVGSPAYNIDWVEKYLSVQGHSGDEWDVLCPVHGEKNASMRVNVAKGVCFCHGCGIKGSLPKLARQMGVPYTGNRTEVDMAGLLRKLDALQVQSRGKSSRPKHMPETELNRFNFPTTYWTDPLPHGRGFTPATVEAFDLGYDPMNECAIIPIRDVDGHLIGFTRRFLAEDADRKYKDPKGFEKGRNLYGSWFAARDSSSYVVLCEGPLDAIKIWQAGHPAVAQFGSNLTSEQVTILRRMGVVTVVLFYDNDSAGKKAVRSAHGWTRKLMGDQEVAHYDPSHDLRRSFVVRRVNYATVTSHDPGGMSDVDIHQLVLGAETVYNRTRT